MRRRQFIWLLGGSALTTWPFKADAQQDRQMRRVGMLLNAPEADAEMMARVGAFERALKDLGWILGTNLRLDVRYTVENDALAEKAKELLALAPDVILANATPTVAALLKVTRTVPIVFVAVTDPVGSGFVQNLARPTGNTTGFLTAEFGFGAKLLELLKEVAPSVRKVIIVTDLENRSAAPQFAAIQAVAPSAGVDLTLLDMNDKVSFERQIGELARSGNVGVIALRLSDVITHRALIIKLAAQYRLPAVHPLRIFVADGGLISYGPDTVDHFRQAASYVARILKGDKPADLPIQAPTHYTPKRWASACHLAY